MFAYCLEFLFVLIINPPTLLATYSLLLCTYPRPFHALDSGPIDPSVHRVLQPISSPIIVGHFDSYLC